MPTAPDIHTAADPMAPLAHRIVERRDETYDTFTVVLDEPTDRGFLPGQFNMLYRFGVGESAISISGDPGRPGRLVHTIRRVGSVTSSLAALQPGDVIGVRGPFGRPWPVEDAEGCDLVIVAGGIGLAPLRSAIYHVLEHRDRYGSVSILVGARSPDDIVYRDEIQEWRGRFDLDVEVTVDSADRSWRGPVGVVTPLVRHAAADPERTVAMVCGPEIMMRFAATELLDRGVAPERIHISMERNMKCAVGFCGHCQFGPHFVCWEGPVFSYDRIGGLLDVREV